MKRNVMARDEAYAALMGDRDRLSMFRTEQLDVGAVRKRRVRRRNIARRQQSGRSQPTREAHLRAVDIRREAQ